MTAFQVLRTMVAKPSSKKGKGSKTATSDKKPGNSAEKTEELKENGGGREEGGKEGVEVEGGRRRGGLKAFIRQMEGSSHRVVEMRLGVVGACGVAFRVLMYDDLSGREETAWSVLTLVGGEGSDPSCQCSVSYVCYTMMIVWYVTLGRIIVWYVTLVRMIVHW